MLLEVSRPHTKAQSDGFRMGHLGQTPPPISVEEPERDSSFESKVSMQQII